MKYIADNMLNGLVDELKEHGIKCQTAIHEIWGDDDSSKPGRHDAMIFKFLLEKKYRLVELDKPDGNYTIITADKDLARYCQMFGLGFELAPKPATESEFKELGADLAAKFKAQRA